MKELRQRVGAIVLVAFVITGFVGMAFGVGYLVGKLIM